MELTIEDLNKLNEAIDVVRETYAKVCAAVDAAERAGENADCGKTDQHWLGVAVNALNNVDYR